ncbi:MAG: aminotransferase class I/II-fold pyridoxal phosphate-dependent enzyme [Eubacterium sp.]|nr:aminotransferase class I/II-fold pyridoxal phosphate-dependent enzyme [Eubacterium sp.]
MKYDFTSIINRHGMDAAAIDAVGKWEIAPTKPREGFDFIPMWVADMNFATAPSITEAILERTKHPLFGYFSPKEEYFDSIIRWQEKQNGMEDLKKEYIGYENGVLGGVVSAVRCYAEPGDSILLHSPCYIGFIASLKKNGYRIIYSPLVQDQEGIYRMDYEDMDQKIKEYQIQVAIFCSPHNPAGRAWNREELKKAADLFEENHVKVISDEIWSDILLNGHKHIPFQMVSPYARKNTVALYAPSKTFNLAGLIGSYHIIYNKKMRERIRAHSERTHYNSMNVLSMHALIGAYQDTGLEWLMELKKVLSRNVNYACNYIRENFEGVEVTKPEATYMLFLDAGEWCEKHGKNIRDLLEAGWDVGVGWQDGAAFQGPTHIRMNLALPFERVEEALRRLKEHVF